MKAFMMTKDLERKIADSMETARNERHEFVTLEHILLSLTETPLAVEILQSVNVDVPALKSKLRNHIKSTVPKLTEDQLQTYGGFESWQPELSLACHRLFQRAAVQVHNSGKNKITEAHILICMFYEKESFATYFMQELGATQFAMIEFVSHGLDHEKFPTLPDAKSGLGENDPLDLDGLPKDSSKMESEKNISALDRYCVNLNKKAADGKIDPLIGRELELERIEQILCRRAKNNPLLIGEPGVGKTAVIEGLALKIHNKEVPELIANKNIYLMDLGDLLAGTKFRGDFESRLKSIIKDAIDRKNVVLFIDEIHTLVGAGATGGGSMDAGNLLKPFLSNGEISCIGSTTQTEFRQHFEKDRALNRRFQRVEIKEPTRDQSIQILKGLRSRLENFHNFKVSDEAICCAVDLSIKYLHGKLLPDKAIDVIDEAGARARLFKQSKNGEIYELTLTDIETVISKMAQVPAQSISSNEKDQLKELEPKLKSQIFGQDEAIEKLVSVIKLSRSGLVLQEKPIGSLLFTGPTGVGKTEVTKQLAEILGLPFIRFDMSEYMEKHTVARLVGAPPGYVGFEEGGQLTEAVSKTPYAVVLLDEIEKAHHDIYNILLQIMDAGRLTDSNGRTTDFKNVILVLTSNAGASDVAKGSVGIVKHSSSSISSEALKKMFAPEFLNRLDAIVNFNNLDFNIILKVLDKHIVQLSQALQKKNVLIDLTDTARKFVAQKGYDPIYGARPMARAVDEFIKKPLVDELLFGKLKDGGKVLFDIEKNNNELRFFIVD